MKKIWFTSLSLFLILSIVHAQHCPFDGSSMVVIKLTDSKGNVIKNIDSSLFLYENANPLADSCSYAQGRLLIPFEKAEKALLKKFGGAWESRAVGYADECSFMKEGYYVVVLNQAQADCMVKEGSSFRYIKRLFEISYQKEKKAKTLLMKVPDNLIYPLCTSVGKWSRILPVEISLTVLTIVNNSTSLQ